MVTGRDPDGPAPHDGAAREEERHLRRALERAAAQWRTTFDAIASPIVNLDANGRIDRLNRAARDLTGLDYPELIGRPVGELGAGVLFDQAARLAEQARRTGSPASATVEDDGAGVVWDVVARVRDVSAETEDGLVVVVARDVTRQVELQESLRRSEVLSALGSLVGGVAHQMRNPLFGISAAAEAFEARFGDTEGAKRYVDALREPVKRLSQLINQLLEYGRPPELRTERTDLVAIVSAAVRACAVVAEHSGVGLAWQPPESHLVVDVDRTGIRGALVNVIENAVQHSSEGGTVEIAAGPDTERNNGSRWVCCTVRDRGPGFRDEELARLCEPFYSRRHGGTGLGLAVVQRTVHEHGGRLRLGNAGDGGAEVRISLPSAETGAGA